MYTAGDRVHAFLRTPKPGGGGSSPLGGTELSRDADDARSAVVEARITRSTAGEPLLTIVAASFPDAGRPISTADVVPPRGTVRGTNATSARPSTTRRCQLPTGWRLSTAREVFTCRRQGQAEIRHSPSPRSENRHRDIRRSGPPRDGCVGARSPCRSAVLERFRGDRETLGRW